MSPTVSEDSALVCKQCGARAVYPQASPGRTVRCRNMAALAIPADFPIPTCSRCRALLIDAQTKAALSPLMQAGYRNALRRRVRRAIDTLIQHISQRRLEMLLGLSQGYLSRLRSGSGNPSPELVSHLALIANDPKTRLSELERYWAEPTLDGETGIAQSASGAEHRAALER